MLWPASPSESALCQNAVTPRPTSPSTLVFVDLEVGGLQTWRPILQLAAMAVDASFQELEVFEAKVRFRENQVTARTLRRRHYRRVVWRREGRPAKDVAVDFSTFLARHATVGVRGSQGQAFAVAQLVAHHAEFDGPFLRAWFERQHLFFPGSYRVLCTMHRALWFFQEHPALPPPTNFQLGTLCRYFGVPWNPRQAHEALADVRATVGLYRKLVECQHQPAALPGHLGYASD